MVPDERPTELRPGKPATRIDTNTRVLDEHGTLFTLTVPPRRREDSYFSLSLWERVRVRVKIESLS
jgi:hypothetical protein